MFTRTKTDVDAAYNYDSLYEHFKRVYLTPAALPEVPKVSVVIPSYNYARYLPECIDSVLAQTYPNVEIIVVNDGSTENDAEVARRYGSKIRLLDLSNRGQSSARNAGVLCSTGDFILPLDADDCIPPDFLSELVPLMVPGVGVIHTPTQLFGSAQILWEGEPILLSGLLQRNVMPVSSLIRREAFLDVGGYNHRIDGLEDWNLWIDIKKRGWLFRYVPDGPRGLYRQHGDSVFTRAQARMTDLMRKMQALHPELYGKVAPLVPATPVTAPTAPPPVTAPARPTRIWPAAPASAPRPPSPTPQRAVRLWPARDAYPHK